LAESLLDYLAKELNLAYVSDLHKNTYRESMKYMIENLDCRQFSLFDWNDRIAYLLGKPMNFQDCSAAQAFLIAQI